MMMTAADITADMRAVLKAMVLPDPAPRIAFDSPAEAIARRLPSYAVDVVAETLYELNALGLTRVPGVNGTMSPTSTAHPEWWITEEGWKVLLARGEPAPGA